MDEKEKIYLQVVREDDYNPKFSYFAHHGQFDGSYFPLDSNIKFESKVNSCYIPVDILLGEVEKTSGKIRKKSLEWR